MQAQKMFDDRLYTQLLAVIHLVIKQAIVASDNCETEYVSDNCFLLPTSPLN